MKIAIVYSSVTGNTKMVAEAISKEVMRHNDCDVIYFGTVSDSIPQADLYILGSWTDKGNVATPIASFLESLKNTNIAYFGTAGYQGDGEYYNRLWSRVQSRIDSSNTVLGHFYCQGKMPMAVKERYVAMIQKNPEDKQLQVSLHNFEDALSHPNEQDLQNAANWIADILKSYLVH